MIDPNTVLACAYSYDPECCGVKDCISRDWCEKRRKKKAVESTMTKEKPQTNADHIRAMTDAELVEFLSRDGACPPERMYPDGCPNCDRVTLKVCYDCWLDWLSREATG